LTLAEAAAQADQLADAGDERALATLRAQWDDELEMAARNPDFRVRAQAYRAIAQFRFRQKTALLRRGLEDDSPACRGSALVALESLSRNHPGVVNQVRPKLHSLADADDNRAVRRLAIVCLKNASPQPDTIRLLRGLAADDEQDRELRETARKVAELLRKKAGAPR
jgi:HEAT repeat protein